jgi:hypothetical protein
MGLLLLIILCGVEGHKRVDGNTEFIRLVNDYIAKEPSLYGTLLPIRDGMFLIKKIG